jgi:cytochrome c-type biogenesis protein
LADPLALVLSSFAFGILSAGNPCALPLLPGYLGYLSSQSSRLGEKEKSFIGIVLVLGVTTGMVLFALAATLLHISLGNLLTVATPIVVAVLIFFGALLITSHNPFYRLPQLTLPKMGNQFVSAFAYGGLYGVIALPCSSLIILPFTIAVSLSSVSLASAFAIFLFFGLGLGLPVIIVSFLSRAQGDWLVRWFARHNHSMNVLAGVLMIGVALYDLVIVLPFLRIYLPQ